MAEKEQRQTHESFAQLSFHRINGSGKSLYGSPLKHNQVIRMTVSESEMIRDLHETRYHAGRVLFEVDMSPQQFSEVITTLNMGRGTPVTLNRINNKHIDECPHQNERELFANEFKNQIDEVTKTAKKLVEDAQEILSQKTIKAADRKRLSGLLYRIQTDLGSNLSFTNSMFHESMDKAVSAGKHEIESFWRSIVEGMGTQSLAEKANPPQLFNISGEENRDSI